MMSTQKKRTKSYNFLALFVETISDEITDGSTRDLALGKFDFTFAGKTDWSWGVAYENKLKYQCDVKLDFSNCRPQENNIGVEPFFCSKKGTECTAKFFNGATLMTLETSVDLFI